MQQHPSFYASLCFVHTYITSLFANLSASDQITHPAPELACFFVDDLLQAQHSTAQSAQHNREIRIVRAHHSVTVQAKADRVAETHHVAEHLLQLAMFSKQTSTSKPARLKNVCKIQAAAMHEHLVMREGLALISNSLRYNTIILRLLSRSK